MGEYVQKTMQQLFSLQSSALYLIQKEYKSRSIAYFLYDSTSCTVFNAALSFKALSANVTLCRFPPLTIAVPLLSSLYDGVTETVSLFLKQVINRIFFVQWELFQLRSFVLIIVLCRRRLRLEFSICGAVCVANITVLVHRCYGQLRCS